MREDLTHEQQTFRKLVETPTEHIRAEPHKSAKLAQVEHAFTYHAPKPGQQEKYEKIRALAKELAHAIINETPESREQSTALTDLEKCVMMANAAIARHG